MDLTEAEKLYKSHCELFLKSNGSATVFGRLEGMQDLAKALGLGDCFKSIRDQYMSRFEKLVY